jgi:hypothetical protein
MRQKYRLEDILFVRKSLTVLRGGGGNLLYQISPRSAKKCENYVLEIHSSL